MKKNDGDRFNRYRIGLRTVKTSLAVMVSLLIPHLLGVDRMEGFYAGIAAVVVMRETAQESLDIGLGRFIGTLIGGALGLALVNMEAWIPYYREGSYLVLVPLGVLLSIYGVVVLRRENAVIIGAVVFMGIALDTELHAENSLEYVLSRIIFTTLGVVVATLINKFVFPYEKKKMIQ
jgi:uncharacterized membrane protein YgaE (UPF0421/DUF939 family)